MSSPIFTLEYFPFPGRAEVSYICLRRYANDDALSKRS